MNLAKEKWNIPFMNEMQKMQKVTAKMLLLLPPRPFAIPQLAPAGQQRFHFFFTGARGVAGAAVEVGDEVAFLVDAYLLRNQY